MARTSWDSSSVPPDAASVAQMAPTFTSGNQAQVASAAGNETNSAGFTLADRVYGSGPNCISRLRLRCKAATGPMVPIPGEPGYRDRDSY